jgi:hypothetical protein
MIAWKDLETKGYVVVPQAFSRDDVEALVTDFNRGAPPENYPHGFKLVSRRGLARTRPIIETYLEQIRQATSLEVDVINFLTYSHYVTTKLAQKVSCLHQDFDLDYQLTGDHVNYLNFWTPIIKPDRERSNIRVIPLDALPAAAYKKIVGGGGYRLLVSEGRTSVEGQSDQFWLDLDIEEFGVTLPTVAGDLVVLRGDVPHRTQDVETLRVAASIRATSTNKSIARERAQVDDPKLQDMLDRCFDKLGSDAVTVGEFVAFSQGNSS